MKKLCILIFCLLLGKLFAQQVQNKASLFPPLENADKPDKKIRIQRTDSLMYEYLEWGEYRKLIGHVELRDSNATMWCDSAILDITANYLTAYGNPVHLKDGDSIDVWGNFLEYFGDQKQARLSGNTIMRDKQMILTAPEFYYNTASDVGYFENNGRMTKDKTILTSKRGYYYHANGEAIFYDHVVLKNDEMTIYADSMRYNSINEIVYFITKTTIKDKDSNIIITESGYYDTKTEKATFDKNTTISKDKNLIKGEHIDYDNKTKNALAHGNVSFQDTVENVTILSGQTIYRNKDEYIKAIDDPLFITVSESKEDTIVKRDTMYLSADTLISFKIALSYYNEDSVFTVDSVKIMKAYHHTKLMQRNLFGICDSLYYSGIDSTFKLYYAPILWIDSIQISGDSMYIVMKNEKISNLNIYNNAFMIQWVESDIFNQIKGKNIVIDIENDKIKLVKIDGNAESIYYVKDNESGYMGGNQSESGNIIMSFKDGAISRIKLINAPEAIYTPMKKISTTSYKLDGFNWQWEKKPKDKYDIIRNKQRYDDFISKNPLYYNKY